jgi:DNA-binding MarR family transcriptional regulator
MSCSGSSGAIRHAGTEWVTITHLADALGLSMSATSALIQRLVDANFVHREEMEVDRRQKCITLTRAGTVLIDRVSAQRAAEIGRGVAGLPPPLREELLAVLERVVDHLRVNEPHTSS